MGRTAGFSVIELAVCLSMAAVIAAMGVQFYRAFAAEQQLKAAVFTLRADLNRVKSRARAANRLYRVVFSATGYQLQRSDNAFNFTLDEQAADGGVELERSFAGTAAIRVSRASASPVFHPKGMVAVPSTVILHNSRGSQRRITISVAGRIKVGA